MKEIAYLAVFISFFSKNWDLFIGGLILLAITKTNELLQDIINKNKEGR